MTELYCVFERNGEAYGISQFGTTRNIIHTLDGVSISIETVELDQLPGWVGDLKRQGFSLSLSDAFYDDTRHCFVLKHPDFGEKTYFCFCTVGKDVGSDVSQLESIARPLLQSDMRADVLSWLSMLDKSQNMLVVPKASAPLVLVFCEWAISNKRALFTAYPGVPKSAPSLDRKVWTTWLQNYFALEDVINAFDMLKWARPVLPTLAQAESANVLDPLSFTF